MWLVKIEIIQRDGRYNQECRRKEISRMVHLSKVLSLLESMIMSIMCTGRQVAKQKKPIWAAELSKCEVEADGQILFEVWRLLWWCSADVRKHSLIGTYLPIPTYQTPRSSSLLSAHLSVISAVYFRPCFSFVQVKSERAASQYPEYLPW